ncbi:phosphomannomutase/phosphoglucomutase [Acetonema longum]|uniref:Phosphomannomutase/phosphoglucomutase n=1 Tax=Acetonema longum DSM 6540 TaxID=1009370 RepID=F7NJD6_9FIRM|nr:phosphomannomutase/phosphoglucomutase [Acetonema longum]EGO63884.1 phosphomannomutase/phosphoglucomutase [Acetonema longum DSM 6540]
MRLFQACDIRGIAGKDLTDEMAARIGRAVGVKLSGQKVVVGGDVRLSTPGLQAIMVKALAESGCHVLDIGTVATPVFYYALKQTQADGGVMVTASHNPAPYNGFKPVLGSQPVTEEDIAEIGEMVAENARIDATGKIEQLTVIEDYLADTAAKAAPGKLRVVVDAGNGATSTIAPRLYRSLGYEVIELFCQPDGLFPNRAPNPALAENLVALGEAVRRHGAALGIAFDGDGDRVGFVDEQGRAADNDDILVLLARHYLEKSAGPVIYDAKCSMVVPEEIARAGGRPVMARAGHTFSKTAFIREKALLAGEISGHFFLSELGYDDAMFAGLKVAEFVAAHQSLAALLDDIPNYLLTPDIRVPYSGSDKEAILDDIAYKLAIYQPNRIDGVRIDFPDGWAMIRASVTEPLFTLRFEAKSAQRLTEIAGLLLNAVPEAVRQAVVECTPREYIQYFTRARL